MHGGSHLSKSFFDLVKAIGEAKSKQDEDRTILNEIDVLKTAMSQKRVSSRDMREYLIRMMYCEMLGHDASWGYIHAVKMTTSDNLFEKRVGYLACSVCLSNTHPLVVLLVNTLQHDVRSDNHLEVATGLIVCCKLINRDCIPAVFDFVMQLLDHPQANVRKKAIMVIHKFYELDTGCIMGHLERIQRVLCDRDPAVMGASLHLLMDLAQKDPTMFKDLCPSLISILKQITENRLPRDYNYRRAPAPWIQISILQFLGLIGQSDKTTSEGMYEIILDLMKRADITTNIGCSIIYEAVRTVCAIYPNASLLEEAARSISRFVSSDNHNLKYLGLNALASIVQINANYVTEHQLVVIDCLEDPDETLQRKTLDLLYQMTTPDNVTVITDKLIKILRGSVDVFFRTELVRRITHLSEKYAPDHSWYIQTMNKVFELGGELVRSEVVHSLLKLIAENPGADDDDSRNVDLQKYAVESYIELLNGKRLNYSDNMIQVMTWVLGEYSHCTNLVTSDEVVIKLISLFHRNFDDQHTKSWIITAIMKICSQMGRIPDIVTNLLQKHITSMDTELQQRIYEFHKLSVIPKLFQRVCPIDKFNEDIEIDSSLSFCDNFVQTALDNGMSPYINPLDEDFEDTTVPGPTTGGDLNFKPYAVQSTATNLAGHPGVSDSITEVQTNVSEDIEEPDSISHIASKLGVRKLWGEDGYSGSSTISDTTTTTVTAPTNIYTQTDSDMNENDVGQPIDDIDEDPEDIPESIKPVVSTEKEKLMKALFGGSSITSHTKQTKTQKKVVPSVFPVDKSTNDDELDLLGVDISNSTVTQVKTEDMFSALDDVFMSAITPIPSNQQKQKTGVTEFIPDPIETFSMQFTPPSQPINTATFGQQWKIIKKENKFNYKTKLATNTESIKNFLTKINFSIIQVIDVEVIACSDHASGNRVFLHTKINSSTGTIIMKIKCKDYSVGNSIGIDFEKIL